MATVKDMKKSFCDDVYTELSGMKDRIMKMQENLVERYGEQYEFVERYQRHLCELAEQIDWKLQILSHACPYDWSGSTEYEENIVSVGPAEPMPGPEFAGGYIGG